MQNLWEESNKINQAMQLNSICARQITSIWAII